MKRRLIKLIALVMVALLVFFAGGSRIWNSLFRPSTAYAVGDLTVNWGVAEGQPIFTVNNFAPGEQETRVVNVANGATSSRPAGVRGELNSETNQLSTVLDFVIRDGSTDVYGGGSPTGPKTLAQFLSESATISGVPLSIIPTDGNSNYSFVVTFQETAGNNFQSSNISFDLHIGVFFQVPAECQAIPFSGEPIFGTSGNDNINGGNGNNLIIGFEGNDTLKGGNGSDCIISGNGTNNISGGNGKDFIVTGDGNDTIDGGNEDDEIIASGGNDNIRGGNGKDRIFGGDGNDVIKGGNESDEIFGEGGNDTISGDNGNDILSGGDGVDSAAGGNGTDNCSAEVENQCEI